MKIPYFSIIIPVYKVEDYLPKCLNSIVSQGFNDFELILVNDGSPDDSLAICQDYAAKFSNIMVIDQDNGGPSSARNNALDHASGKYVMFIDSDDWIEPNTLEKLYEQSSDNCPLIYYGFRQQFGEGDFKTCIHGYRHSTNIKEYYDILYHTMDNRMGDFIYGFTCNKLFSREIIEQHHLRFDTRLHVKEDEVFTNQFCSFVREVKIVPYSFYNYRMSFGNSVSFIKRKPSEYEHMADKLLETNFTLTDSRIQDYQRQEYIYNLGKGITAAFRQGICVEAKRLSEKCAKRMKEMKLDFDSFNRVHFKDKIRYRFASGTWIYIISKLFNRFYIV